MLKKIMKIKFNINSKNLQNVNIHTKINQDNYSLRAVHPDHQFLEKTIIDEGRYINQRDLKEKSKVSVIGRLVKEDLFGEKPALGNVLM